MKFVEWRPGLLALEGEELVEQGKTYRFLKKQWWRVSKKGLEPLNERSPAFLHSEERPVLDLPHLRPWGKNKQDD